MKGKLADAMLTGTPSVTTTIGAESMYANYDWPGSVTDNDEDISNAAIALYENEILWHEKQNNIIPIINNVFNKKEHEEKFISRLSNILTSLENHRDKNFTGKMLRHHTLKSAMYMSQWIEAKNKNKDNHG